MRGMHVAHGLQHHGGQQSSPGVIPLRHLIGASPDGHLWGRCRHHR
jgi:hypothetical protein